MAHRPTHARGIEEQLWPIVCATVVLMGVLTVVIAVNSDFDDERLLLNGYTQLAAVAALGAAVIFIASLIKGTARRTAELAILLSLALHAVGGLAAVYLFDNTSLRAARGNPRDSLSEPRDDAPPVADYHWGQDDRPQAEQVFEQPMASAPREQSVAAARLQPVKIERSPSSTAVPRRPAEAEPLADGLTDPDKPANAPRRKASKGAELPSADDLALVRPKASVPSLPDLPAPKAEAAPAAPKTPERPIQPKGVQIEKSDAYVWPTPARRMADPKITPAAPLRRLPRSEVDAFSAARSKIEAHLPSQAPPHRSTAQLGADAANELTQDNRLARSAETAPLLAAAAHEGPSLAPRAAAASAAPRLEAAATREFGRAASLISPVPSRSGASAGRGNLAPSLADDGSGNPADLRPGSPLSSLRQGVPFPAVRRGETQDENDDAAGETRSNFPRHISEVKDFLAGAGRIAEEADATPGRGGPTAGDKRGTLDVGQEIKVRRTADRGALGAGGPRIDSSLGDVALTGGAAGVSPALASGGPRRVSIGASEGDDNGIDNIPHARGGDVDPRATIESPVPTTGIAGNSRGPVQGPGAQGAPSAALAPPSTVIGKANSFGSGGMGTAAHSGVSAELDELALNGGVDGFQRVGPAGRAGAHDDSLDSLLSGDEGPGVARGRGDIALNTPVHDPLAGFGRGGVGGPVLGNPTDGQLTEPAIENGLEYFSLTQFPDGHWSLHEAPPGVKLGADSLGDLHADTAATALALLAYIGGGYKHQGENGKYRETLRRGLDWLVKHQSRDGDLSYQDSPATHFYSHGIATIALCEAYGSTRDPELRGPAQKAIDFIVRSQDPHLGGWRYLPRDGSDTSVTCWQIMALYSAQLTGVKSRPADALQVPNETMRKAGHWLDLAQVPGKGTYVYNPASLDTPQEREGREPNPTMTAQAMLMRMYLEQDKDQHVMQQGADYLKEHLPRAGAAQTDCYYWYYGTQAMYRMGGDYWKTWYAQVTPLVRAGQVEKGPLKGSWSGLAPAPDHWTPHAGRHYITAMHILTLDFPYWNLPLHRDLQR